MDFDWLHVKFDLNKITDREIEESFEDPFSIRLLPSFDDDSREARYFSLGRTLNNRPLFTVFWTDGKIYRIIFAREMTDTETAFYERKNAEMQ